MSRLKLCLLGAPRAELDGAPVEIERRKTLALLAYLAVTGSSGAAAPTRDSLAALLWPEAEPARAYAGLRHALWELHQALGESTVLADRETIRLNPDLALQLDVADFRARLTEARQRQADCAASVPRLSEAAALYAGDFLAGFNLKDAPDFDEWAYFQAEGLRRDLAIALEQLADCLAALGQGEAAISHARRRLALDPLNETAHRQLMRLYAQTGQRALALRQYQECARRLREELDTEPQPETGALHEQIRSASLEPVPPPAARRPRSNLPASLTSFVGRERELAEVRRLLDPSDGGPRLLTLTGPGGTGKTRLSLQAGLRLQDAFSDGVWLVELALLADPALLPQAVAGALGVREEVGRPLSAVLLEHLRPRTALVILDNCEHLVEAAARWSEAALHHCPQLRVLASSREALGVAGESIYRVPSLSFPRTPQQASDVAVTLNYEAVRLFVERAAAVQPGFGLTDANAGAVAQICQRLDGIPLALELAAARVPVLSPEQIAARLNDRFRLLTGGSRTALPRHQTLRALIDWSHDLLTEPERVLLRRLSVFAGGWTLEAAETVCADAGGAPDVLDRLAALDHKSLLLAEDQPQVGRRYRLLEIIRQYAREKLWEAGEADLIRRRHLAHFLGLARQAKPELSGPQQEVWLKRLRQDLDNLRAALEWALESDIRAGLELVVAVCTFYSERLPLSECACWLEELLQHPQAAAHAPEQARATLMWAEVVLSQGDNYRAQELAQAGLTLCEAVEDRVGQAAALGMLGTIHYLQDERGQAHGLLARSLAEFEALGDKRGASSALSQLGQLYSESDYPRARAYLEKGLDLCRELGHTAGIGAGMYSLGELALWHGDLERAVLWIDESLRLARRLESPGVAWSTTLRGLLALRQGDPAQAQALLEESLAASLDSGDVSLQRWTRAHLGFVALRQGELARARALFDETQQVFRESGSRVGVVYALEGLAGVALAEDRPERAVRLYAWADTARDAIADPRPPVEQTEIDRDLAALRERLAPEALAAAQAEGRALTEVQAIADALAGAA